MPDAQPAHQNDAFDLAALERLLLPIREQITDLVPTPSQLPEEQIVRSRGKGGGSSLTVRSLDVPATRGSAGVLDRVLEAVHDVAQIAFQVWLDRLADQASPHMEQNKAVAEMILERADRFGFGLYYRHMGEIVRVRIGAQAPTPTQITISQETVTSGYFKILSTADPSIYKSCDVKRVTSKNGFPPLIVARTHAQAEAIWHERNGLVGEQGESEHSTSRSKLSPEHPVQ